MICIHGPPISDMSVFLVDNCRPFPDHEDIISADGLPASLWP